MLLPHYVGNLPSPHPCVCLQRWNLRERRPATLSDASLEGSELEMSAEATPLNMPRKRKAVEQQKVRRETFFVLPVAALAALSDSSSQTQASEALCW